MTQDRHVEWMRLDNAGKIFPATSDKRDTGVFRVSCELKGVCGSRLSAARAGRGAAPVPVFSVRIARRAVLVLSGAGDFIPQVHEEDRPVCSPLYNRGKKTPLFDISYYGRKINLEVFHALTDGAGAFEFMRTIIYYYVTYRHPAQFQDEPPLLDYDASTSHRKEDSFPPLRGKGEEHEIPKPAQGLLAARVQAKPYRYRVIEGIASLLRAAQDRQGARDDAHRAAQRLSDAGDLYGYACA